MAKDPFAEDTTEKTEDTATGVEVTAEQDADGSIEVSVTLKGGRDFDAPWVVVRAGSVGDALAALDEDMQELLKATAKYGRAFATLASEGKPAAASGGGQSRQAPGPKSHPDGKKEFCQHGEMDYKSGITKSGKNQGKTWHAFDCSEGVCDRKWDNDK